MKEEFLHYLWKFKKFNQSELLTVNGEEVKIINSGQFLSQDGPDFFNAQILINKQKWAGNVEIHLKSSDWYAHHHERDSAYENVILHVVWEHDAEVFRKDNTEIPVLELKKHVDTIVFQKYQSLTKPKTWIYCEKQIATIDYFVWNNWKERLFFERLERKSLLVFELLESTKNDWEAVLFYLIAKNFGLNSNGEVFFKIAKSIPYSIIRKESFEVENLESLFFGKALMLTNDKEDLYFKELKKRFEYLKSKYQFEQTNFESLQFFKHRPDNFPTIRLSQLANLYHKQQQLFSKIISVKTPNEVYDIFNISSSDYWQTHYLFDKESLKKQKKLSKSFIDLLIINTIIPFLFAYAKAHGNEISENLIQFMQNVLPEKNTIINKFDQFGIKCKNAFDTQSLLQLKNEYCNKSKCLDCVIGIELLKSK